jgi:transcription elongation GreA/GreB family factor
MDRNALKGAVLRAAAARLEVTANELRARIEELKAVTIGDENAESASQTEHTRGGDLELMSSLGKQLEHVMQDAERLASVSPDELMDTVQFGAVVHTDQRDLLIGVSLEEFEALGRSYLGVTPKAPLVQALLGLRKGEVARVNGLDYAIQELC